MHEAVSDILNDRARQAHGINMMLLVSLAGHAVLLAALVAMPSDWRSAQQAPEPDAMVISLGGAPGPANTGMTQMSSRTVQTVAPPEAKPSASATPMASTPEMIVPDRTAKPSARAKPVEKPAERSTSRSPTTGAEARTGSTRMDTGAAAVPFGGLASGGGGGSGVTVDLKNFCCPAYLQTMIELMRRNWKPNQGADGSSIVRFVILRDGRIANVEISKTSNNPLLDLESRRAILMTARLPPLPQEYPGQTLTIEMQFNYQR